MPNWIDKPAAADRDEKTDGQSPRRAWQTPFVIVASASSAAKGHPYSYDLPLPFTYTGPS